MNHIISRKQFLKDLGLSSSALWAVYCSVSLSACKNEDANMTPNVNTKLSFSLNLSDQAYANLKTNGGYVVVNDVVIAKTITGTFVAVSRICSHQANKAIVYNAGEFFCTVHGSRFSESGKVIGGPAINNILQYQVVLLSNTLTITEP
jgi:Rieske Fe-S protein